MKIAVVGAGYVGLANAVLLSQQNEVFILDTSEEKIEMLKDCRCPIDDRELKQYIASGTLLLSPTSDRDEAFSGADFIIIAVPTNYNPAVNYFDTSLVEAVIVQALDISPNATIVIKSTVPIGFTESVRKKLRLEKSSIIFSPEFLREGYALHDNLHPSRIVVGGGGENAKIFAELLRSASINDGPVLFTGTTEAEAIKLFSNTYLAMRVSYFNELDTYAALMGLNAREIIDGVSLDQRIGGHYNNPSFGFGGYCLPKDTKQMAANYRVQCVPQNLISAIVDSNETRKEFIAESVIATGVEVVGVYRMIMKDGADNCRDSSICGIIDRLISAGLQIIIYEPFVFGPEFMACRVENDFELFSQQAGLILTNRNHTELSVVAHKVYSRDIYGIDI